MNWTTTEHHVARKMHRCSVCIRRIDPGETYGRQRGFDGGDVWTFRSCAHCEAVTALYDPRDMDDLISEDGHAGWTEGPGRDIAELRAQAGFRMGWRARSGRLLPIPELAAGGSPLVWLPERAGMNVIICREPMEEISRKPDGDRWCFRCRKVRAFDFVVDAPVEPSYYEPNPSVRCGSCGLFDGDLFPGRSREWR